MNGIRAYIRERFVGLGEVNSLEGGCIRGNLGDATQ